MGAHDFSDTAFGKNITDAYANARREAEYQYGHDPYSGTIATTSGVIDVSEILAPFSAKRRDVIAYSWGGVEEYDPNDQWQTKPKRGGYSKLVTVPPQPGSREYRTKQYIVPREIRPAEAPALARLAEMVEKWGPALGYEVTGTLATEIKARHYANGKAPRGTKVYRFFGLAAS
jgi:hypothetical protein